MESTIRAPVQRSAAYRVWQNVRTYLNGQDYVPRTDIQPPPVPQRSPTLEWQLRAHRATTSALVALVDLNANAIQLGEAPAPHMAEMISYLREDSQRREVALEKSGEKARYGTAIDNYLDTLQQNREQMEQTDLPPRQSAAGRKNCYAERSTRRARWYGAHVQSTGHERTIEEPAGSRRSSVGNQRSPRQARERVAATEP